MDPSTLIAALPARYATLALALCGLAAAIAMFLPPPSATSSSTYRTVYGLVNLLAANKFHASNANAPASPLAGPGAPVLVLPLLLAIGLGACTATQQATVQTALASPPGQLFCALQTAGGGAMVVRLINAEATSLAPGAAPVAVIATGLAKATVDADCAAAGVSAGGAGIAVSPPANPDVAPQVAIVVPAAT